MSTVLRLRNFSQQHPPFSLFNVYLFSDSCPLFSQFSLVSLCGYIQSWNTLKSSMEFLNSQSFLSSWKKLQSKPSLSLAWDPIAQSWRELISLSHYQGKRATPVTPHRYSLKSVKEHSETRCGGSKVYAEKLLGFCWSWCMAYTRLCLSAHVLPGEFNSPEKLELAQFDQLSSAWVPRGFFPLFIWLAGNQLQWDFIVSWSLGTPPPQLLSYKTLIKVWNKNWWISTSLSVFIYSSLSGDAGHISFLMI